MKQQWSKMVTKTVLRLLFSEKFGKLSGLKLNYKCVVPKIGLLINDHNLIYLRKKNTYIQ